MFILIVQMFQESPLLRFYQKNLFFNLNYFVLMFHLLFKSKVVRKLENTFYSNALKYFFENPDPRPLIKHLQGRRVLRKSAFCSTCLTPMNLQNRKDSQDGLQWRCPKTGCNTKLSVRNDSRFKGFKLSLQIIIKILWKQCLEFSVKAIFLEIGVSQRTVGDLFHFLELLFVNASKEIR